MFLQSHRQKAFLLVGESLSHDCHRRAVKELSLCRDPSASPSSDAMAGSEPPQVNGQVN